VSPNAHQKKHIGAYRMTHEPICPQEKSMSDKVVVKFEFDEGVSPEESEHVLDSFEKKLEQKGMEYEYVDEVQERINALYKDAEKKSRDALEAKRALDSAGRISDAIGNLYQRALEEARLGTDAYQQQQQQIDNLAQELGVEILDYRDDDFLRVGQVMLLGPYGGIVVKDELPTILDALKFLENIIGIKEVTQ
jgi:hypothetical protein